MRLASVLDVIETFSEAHKAAHPELANVFAASEPPMPRGLALGVAPGRGAGDYHVAVRCESAALAERIRDSVAGEADIRFVRPQAIPPTWEPPVTTAAEPVPHSVPWLQSRQRPLECGMQVNVVGRPFVGTLGVVVKDVPERATVRYALSNSHVFDGVGGTPAGTPVAAPFGSAAPIGVADRFVALSKDVPNLVDCRLARLSSVEAASDFNGALQGRLRGVRAVRPEDLGAEVLKIGRTTGVRSGRISAVGLNGLPVNYGDAGILRFNDQIEVTGGAGPDFSAAGDSGSLILFRDGFACALLFAGGMDSQGEDRTYGNRLELVLARLGVQLAT